VIRRTTFVLSLTTVGVGIWLITRVGPLNAACNSNAPTAGFGASTDCMNIVSSYFIGYALTIGGLVILALALMSISHRNKKYVGQKRQTTIPGTIEHFIESQDR